MKFHPLYVCRFLKTYTFSDYEQRNENYARHNSATEWDQDDFVSFISNHLEPNDNLDPAIATIFGVPRFDIVKTYGREGSGYNNDLNWNKYQSWRSALYDVWAEIQTHLN